MNDQLYSYHIFLFSFQWSYTGRKYRTQTIEEKNNLTFFCKCLNEARWNRKKLVLNSCLAYNEYSYFYDFVRHVLYDKDFPLSPDGNAEAPEENFVAHFEYDIQPDQEFYTFTAPEYNKSPAKQYRLHIESIILHL